MVSRHLWLALAFGPLVTISTFPVGAEAAPVVEVIQKRPTDTATYRKSLARIAVYGDLHQEKLRHSLLSCPFRVVDSLRAGNAIVLSLEPDGGNAITSSDYDAIGVALRSLPEVEGTGPVYFDGVAAQIATGRFWIYLPRGAGMTRAQALLAPLGLKLVDYVEGVDGIAVVVPTTKFSVEETGQRLMQAGLVVVPELMRKLRPMLLPSDPYFSKQWTLRNTGSNVTRPLSLDVIPGMPHADARVSEAWDFTTGSSDTLVAVLDSGVDCTHPELKGKCEAPYNAIDKTNDATPPPASVDALSGHGTSVAGIIGAPIDGTGMVGVCPACRIIPVRLIDGTYLTDLMIYRAFKHAVDEGASVINNSWGPSLPGAYFAPISQGELQGIKYAGQGREGRGVLVVYAAGNDNADTKYLGHLQTEEPNVMAVAASNHFDMRSVYSNYGMFLDISAPSNDSFNTPSILSLEPLGFGDLVDYTSFFGGTSAAAPVVSGVAALILSLDPTKTAAEVREILTQTADKIDADMGFYDASGFSVKYGHGRVNAYRALLAVKGLSNPSCEAPATVDDCNTSLDENCDGLVNENCSTPNDIGLICSSPSQCGTGPDWECPSSGKVQGVCTVPCHDAPCPMGSACLLGQCVPYCNEDHPCPQTDTVCTDMGLGVCLRRCHSDGDCTDGEVCDPELGYCVLDTDGFPGSPCIADECKGTSALCLSESMGFIDGYCTHSCMNSLQCENAGKCIASTMGSFCYSRCTFDADCRPTYVCEQAGPRANTCYKKCDKDSQCRGTESAWDHVVCDLSTGRCIYTDEIDGGMDAETDGSVEGDADVANEASTDAWIPDPQDGAIDVGQDGPSEAAASGDGCACRMRGQSKESGVAGWVWALLALAWVRRRTWY